MDLLNELQNDQILPFFWKLQNMANLKVRFLSLEGLKTELLSKNLSLVEEKKFETILYGNSERPLYTGWTKQRLKWACLEAGFTSPNFTNSSEIITEAHFEKKNWGMTKHLLSMKKKYSEKTWEFRKKLRKFPQIVSAKSKTFFKTTPTNFLSLNLGAGEENYPGYLKVDLSGVQDIYDNIITLKKISNQSVDQIYSNHVLEHIPPSLILPMLLRWNEILKPGAVVRIRVPDALASIRGLEERWEEAALSEIERLGFPNYLFKESTNSGILDSNAAIQCIYGWSDSTPFLWDLSNQHKSLWTPRLARERFENAGFEVRFCENLGTLQTVVVAYKKK